MSAALPAPGQLLEGKYKIVGLVGEGAWGIVLEGVNVRIQRRVAIKILKEEYASNEQMVSRFEREALASTHIESPHVVQVFDAGVLADGRPYLVMEFLTGEDLATHIQKAPDRRLPIVTAVDLCNQIARGLTAAHAAGVFHRDMKPSNIVIAKTKSGREVAKLVDFGISKLLDTNKEPTSNTQTGTILGSPVYMSPEQARGSKTTDHRSDIYSLGVVLYECLTGTTPHSADSFNELLFKIVLEATPSPRGIRPEIDEELDAILRQVLTKTPELRVQTAAELESMLTAWLIKHGGRTADSLTDSGQRGVSGDLKASPISPANPESSGKLGVVNPPSDPQLHATVDVKGGANSHHPDSVAKTIPAPSITSSAPAKSALEASLTPSSSTARSSRTGASGRRNMVIGGAVALAAIAGIIAFTARSGGPKVTGSEGPSQPSATSVPSSMSSSTSIAKPTTSADATNAAATAAADPTASGAASASAAAGTTATPASSARAGGPRGGPVAGGGRTKPTTSAAVTPTATEPTPNGAGSASVGGRTIRTDL